MKLQHYPLVSAFLALTVSLPVVAQAGIIPVQTRYIQTPSGGNIPLQVGFSQFDSRNTYYYKDNDDEESDGEVYLDTNYQHLGKLVEVRNENGVKTNVYYEIDLNNFFGLYNEPGPIVDFYFDFNYTDDERENGGCDDCYQVPVQLNFATLSEDGNIQVELSSSSITTFLTYNASGAYKDTIIDAANLSSNFTYRGFVAGNYRVDIGPGYVLHTNYPYMPRGGGSATLTRGVLTTNPLMNNDLTRNAGWGFTSETVNAGDTYARAIGQMTNVERDGWIFEWINGTGNQNPNELGQSTPFRIMPPYNTRIYSLPVRDVDPDEFSAGHVILSPSNLAVVRKIEVQNPNLGTPKYEIVWGENGPDERAFTFSLSEDGILRLEEIPSKTYTQYGTDDIYVPIKVSYSVPGNDNPITYTPNLRFTYYQGDIISYFTSNVSDYSFISLASEDGENKGRFESEWFGKFDAMVNGHIFTMVNTSMPWQVGQPWINHDNHGSLYLYGTGVDGGFWYWDRRLNRFFFTHPDYYPWVYMAGENGRWLYFAKDTRYATDGDDETPDSYRWFWDTSTSTWIIETDITP